MVLKRGSIIDQRLTIILYTKHFTFIELALPKARHPGGSNFTRLGALSNVQLQNHHLNHPDEENGFVSPCANCHYR